MAHDARLARSGRRLTMLHRWYACDGLFGPHVSNQAVNQAVLLPLMRRVISGEGDATILLYGQTGAGKTHTLMGMMEQVASRFDELCGEDAANSRDGVEVVFFELAAAGCCDLLNSRNLITLRADENDQVRGSLSSERPDRMILSMYSATAALLTFSQVAGPCARSNNEIRGLWG